MLDMSHENVNPFLGLVLHPGTNIAVFQYCSKGSLQVIGVVYISRVSTNVTAIVHPSPGEPLDFKLTGVCGPDSKSRKWTLKIA